MRAACDSCGALQPPDWKPGDLCVACGACARREARCFWCARWTPKGKFCRHCGAEVVDERVYGAARMLKAAGTDQLTVPVRLREFDAERIDKLPCCIAVKIIEGAEYFRPQGTPLPLPSPIPSQG